MKPASQRQTIQCLVNDQWVPCDYSQLEPGDVFRILDSHGTVILFNKQDRLLFKSQFTLVEYLSAPPTTFFRRLTKRFTPPVAI